MDIFTAFEIFSLVTGVAYLVLEILQKNAMWIVGILTAAAAVAVFAVKGLYASMALNVYYVVVSFIGLYQWRKDGASLKASGTEGDIHLRRISAFGLALSAAVLVAGTVVLFFVLQALGDPASWLDAGVTMLSALATWWLARSIPQQWLLWIVADLASTALCLTQGMYWMTALYAVYAAGAVYGWIHWKRSGSLVGEAAQQEKF